MENEGGGSCLARQGRPRHIGTLAERSICPLRTWLTVLAHLTVPRLSVCPAACTLSPSRSCPPPLLRYTTRIEADAAAYPVLLGNGNLKETGQADGGRWGAGKGGGCPGPTTRSQVVKETFPAGGWRMGAGRTRGHMCKPTGTRSPSGSSQHTRTGTTRCGWIPTPSPATCLRWWLASWP